MASERKQTKLTSLDALKPQSVDVVIVIDDTREIVVEMRPPSFARWNAINASVPNPTPPIQGATPDKRPIYDYADAGYLQAMTEVNQRRMFLQLLEALVIGVPGTTIEDQIAYLTALDTGMITGLVATMTQLIAGRRVRVEARAETF